MLETKVDAPIGCEGSPEGVVVGVVFECLNAVIPGLLWVEYHDDDVVSDLFRGVGEDCEDCKHCVCCFL